MTRQRAASTSLMLAAGCLLLVACSNSPSVTSNTTAAPSPPSAPPATSPPAPVPPLPTDRSGNYAGTAQPMSTGGGACMKSLQVSGFQVAGNSVRFGRFRGTIDAAGGLQMFHGEQWIVGQFEGTSFNGQFTIPPPRRINAAGLGCSYRLSLDRIGP